MRQIKITNNQYKFLLEESRRWKYYENYKEYRNLNDDDTYFFMIIPPKTTGLSVPIWVDDEASYVMNNHPLWIYFKNGDNGDIEPMSVSRNPQILNKHFKQNISDDELRRIRCYVIQNFEAITQFSNMEIGLDKFYDLIEKKPITESIINESPILNPDVTGLSKKIWVDGPRELQHRPRIKFQANSNKSSKEWATMTIDDKPILKNLPNDSNLTSDEIERIRKFVIYNKDLLLDMSENGNMDFKKNVIPRIIKVSQNGNPLYNGKNIQDLINIYSKEPVVVNPQIINDELYFVINDNDDKSKDLIRKMSKNNNFEFDNPYAVKYKYRLTKEQIEDYIEYVKLIKFFVDIAKSYDFNIEIKHIQN